LELKYDSGRGWWAAPNLDWSARPYFVNSANTAVNGSYAVMGVKAGFDWGHLGLYLEAANLTDRIYSASVVVDDGNSRFFEPANRRSAFAGIKLNF
jgi:iron complex outermembrane receptor protein